MLRPSSCLPGRPLREGLQLGLALEDWSMAYNNIPTGPENYNVSISVVCEIESQEWRFMKHRAVRLT